MLWEKEERKKVLRSAFFMRFFDTSEKVKNAQCLSKNLFYTVYGSLFNQELQIHLEVSLISKLKDLLVALLPIGT
jgi:hypothetical protein